MASTPSALGAISPGIIIQNPAGTFNSLLATSPAQTLISTGVSTYSFGTYSGTSSNSGVAQIVTVNPSSTNVAPPVAFGIPPYNAAAEVAVVNVNPMSATSTFITYFSLTCNMIATPGTGIIGGAAGYFNATGTEIVHAQVNDGSGASSYTAECGGCSLPFTTGSAAPFTVNYCVFMNNVSTTTVSSINDPYTVIELNSSSLVDSLPVFVSTSATPVLAVFIPAAVVNQSTQVSGYVVANDAANQQSNLIQYLFVMQQGGSLAVAPTIAQNTVLVNSITTTSSLTFTPVVGGVNVQFVGIAATTFVCQQSFVTET